PKAAMNLHLFEWDGRQSAQSLRFHINSSHTHFDPSLLLPACATCIRVDIRQAAAIFFHK
ncbi:MAG: hypothetical protein V3U73_13205, partial [bacterium]